MLSCLVCGKPCEYSIHPDFLLCFSCGTASRKKDTIAVDRKGTYGDNWVEKHSTNRDVSIKADYIAKLVKQLLPAGKVLDVGCASGVLVNKLSIEGYDAEGIDWAESAISFATGNMKGNFRIGDADLEAIEGTELYDIIIASHILEHLENPQRLLSGVRRLLKPDSCFCIAVPNLGWYNSNCAWRMVSSIFDPDHIVGYARNGLTKLLSDSGFRVNKVATRTHGSDLLTAICVAGYSKLATGRHKQTPQASIKGKSTTGANLRRTYNAIASSPLLTTIMYLPNRLSEMNDRGMELIVVLTKKEVPNCE